MAASQRRKRVWAEEVATISAATVTQGLDVLADFRGITGATTVGLTVAAINVTQNGAVGVGTGSETTGWHTGFYVDSRNAAVAELSNPQTDPYEDWMWNTKYYVQRTADAGWQSTEYGQYRVRSKRKVDELEQTLWWVGEPILGSATSLDLALHIRILLLLP